MCLLFEMQKGGHFYINIQRFEYIMNTYTCACVR